MAEMREIGWGLRSFFKGLFLRRDNYNDRHGAPWNWYRYGKSITFFLFLALASAVVSVPGFAIGFWLGSK